MRALTLISAATASVLLSGCLATVGDLKQGAENMGKTIQAAVTPVEVMSYRAYAQAATPIWTNAIAGMKRAGVNPRMELVRVSFRDSVGRVYESPLVVSSFRFYVPEDTIEAKHSALDSLVSALAMRLTEWNAVEPLNIIVFSGNADSADELRSKLQKAAPTLRITKQVGTAAAVGYSGVEMRMAKPNLSRQIGGASAANAATTQLTPATPAVNQSEDLGKPVRTIGGQAAAAQTAQSGEYLGKPVATIRQ